MMWTGFTSFCRTPTYLRARRHNRREQRKASEWCRKWLHLILLVDDVVRHEYAAGRQAREHQVEELLVVGLPRVEKHEIECLAAAESRRRRRLARPPRRRPDRRHEYSTLLPWLAAGHARPQPRVRRFRARQGRARYRCSRWRRRSRAPISRCARRPMRAGTVFLRHRELTLVGRSDATKHLLHARRERRRGRTSCARAKTTDSSREEETRNRRMPDSTPSRGTPPLRLRPVVRRQCGREFRGTKTAAGDEHTRDRQQPSFDRGSRSRCPTSSCGVCRGQRNRRERSAHHRSGAPLPAPLLRYAPARRRSYQGVEDRDRLRGTRG